MGLGVTIRTQNDALADFRSDFVHAAIGQRTEVQGKRLEARVDVVPNQRRQILGVATMTTTAAEFFK